MKRFITLFATSLIVLNGYAQCTIVPFSIEKKVYMADIIVEATVMRKECFWNDKHDYIHTTNLLKVTRVFKGEHTTDEVEVITEGGMVGLTALVVEPSLQLELGEVGIFLLKRSELKFDKKAGSFLEPVASVQSFLKYDMFNRTAHGYFENFENITGYLFPLIEKYAQQKHRIIGKDVFGIGSLRQLATPVITSIDKDTLAAGTGELLTITGSNFGIIKGKGFIEFVDPNFGDGRFFEVHYPSSFKSWNNTKIEVYMPPRAGTGKIRITNNSSETGQSAASIVVKYAYSNYPFTGTSSVDSGFFIPRLIDLNGNGGYRWTLSSNFAHNTNAVNAFYRAAENWRCGTLMNWDISGSTTSIKTVAKDNVNAVIFTKFTDSRLGVCSSWYGGCTQGNNAFFYVSELDISFDSTRNWYYGTNKPGKSQFDFETVATHELGHGHQLSHVIDDTKIMHYSLANGDRNTNLHRHDLEGGVFIGNESKSGKQCNSDLYKLIDANDCNITKPKAKLEVNIPSPCPGTDVRFTDKTEGKVTKYAWDFGQGASTATASGTGPYVVNYSTSGDKTISLITTNDFGSDTAILLLKVQADTPASPATFMPDTSCVGQGNQTYQVDAVANATTYAWSLGSGGSISGSSNDRAVVVTWNSAGNHDISVSAKNACGTSAATTQTATVLNKVVSDFDVIDDGMDFEFTNNSTDHTTSTWSFGDGNKSKEESPKHTYATRNTFKVTLIATNVCSSDTFTENVEAKFNVGVSDVAKSNIRLIPNPSDGIFYIEEASNAIVLLTNALGQVVFEQQGVQSSTPINARYLPKGVYSFQIIDANNQVITGKLILR